VASSEIRVVRDGDRPVRGARVVLSFFGGLTDAAHTDSDGVARIDHASTGEAKVFVDGRECGSLRTPGSKTIHT
jgi:hypothetical protein